MANPWERYSPSTKKDEPKSVEGQPWTKYGGAPVDQTAAAPEQAQPGGSYLDSFMSGVDSLADGMTLGIAPYIRGAARGLINGGGVSQGVDTEFKKQAQRREERPVSSFINEAAGGGLLGGGLANAGLTATRLLPAGASRLQRAAAIGADAAGMSAVQGAAEGRDPGMAALTGFGLGAGASAGLEAVGDAAGRFLRGRQVRAAAPSTGDLRGAQKAAYKAFDAEDIALSKPAAQRVVTQAAKGLQDLGLDRKLNPRAYTYLDVLGEQVSRGDGVSMKSLERIRSNIARDLRGSGVQGTEREALGRVSSAIDDFFNTASQSDVIAGGNKTRAYEALKAGRDATKVLKKSEIIDEVFSKSEGGYASGDANALRLGLRAIIRDPKKRSMFTTEELAAIKRAADGSTLQMIMQQLGKLGPVLHGGGSNSLGAMLGMGGGASLGSAIAGPAGAAVGSMALPAAGAAARTASDAMTRRNAEYVQKLINSTGRLPNQSTLQMLLADPRFKNLIGDAAAGAVTQGPPPAGERPIPSITIRPPYAQPKK